MPILRFRDFPEGSGSLTNDDIFLFMDNPSSGGTTKKISLSQLSNIIGAGSGGGGGGNPFDQNLNTTDSPTFNLVSFSNGTTLAKGTFDNSTGGQSGISLNCYVGYELNWQGGHLKSTTDNGVTAANILSDSAIEFPGTGTYNLQIDNVGITFTDGTTQTSANIPSTNITDFNTSVSGLISGNYAPIVHTHLSSDITDFNSSVSGLVSGEYAPLNHNHTSTDITDFNDTVNALVSGVYAPITHNHVSSDITDFNSSVSGLLPIKNILAGTGITVSSNDGAFTINTTALISDPSGIPGATKITNIVQISQTDFDNLPSTDPDTVYIINT